jgi:hypothetical protein
MTASFCKGVQAFDLSVRSRVEGRNYDELVGERSMLEGLTKSTSAFMR